MYYRFFSLGETSAEREEATARKASTGFKFRKGLKNVGSQRGPVSDGERQESASFWQPPQYRPAKVSRSSKLNKLANILLDDLRDSRQYPPLIDVALK